MTSTTTARLLAWTTGQLDGPPVPACPPWCRLPAGHPWDSMDAEGRISRGHESAWFGVPGAEPGVGAAVTVRQHGDGSTEQPRVAVEAGTAPLTGEQARGLAGALVRAADLLVEVTS